MIARKRKNLFGAYAICGSEHISLIEVLCIVVGNPNFTQIYKAPSPAIQPTFCHPRKDPLTNKLQVKAVSYANNIIQGIPTGMTKMMVFMKYKQLSI